MLNRKSCFWRGVRFNHSDWTFLVSLRKFLSIVIPCLILLSLNFTTCLAQTLRPSADEESLLNDVRFHVRRCQLHDGAITSRSYGETDIPADVDPWTGNQVALWMLQDLMRMPDPRISILCFNWFRWCAQNQDAESGHFRRLRGTVTADSRLENTTYERCESDATAAASYLMAVERFSSLGTPSSPEKGTLQACGRSLDLLKRCQDGEFVCSFPPEDVPQGRKLHRSFLQHVAVYQGLLAAERLFSRLNDPARAQAATEMASALARRFPAFWNGSEVYFHALADAPETERTWGSCPLHVDAHHNLMALALFDNLPASNRSRLWQTLKKQCGEDFEELVEGPPSSLETPTLEWMCLAARRVAPKAETDRLQTLFNRQAKQQIQRLRQSIPRAADPQNAKQVAEYDRNRQEKYPAVDRVAFISHVVASQYNHRRQVLPTLAFPWPDPPLPEVGKKDTSPTPRASNNPVPGKPSLPRKF